jgi:hypothetical protein
MSQAMLSDEKRQIELIDYTIRALAAKAVHHQLNEIELKELDNMLAQYRIEEINFMKRRKLDGRKKSQSLRLAIEKFIGAKARKSEIPSPNRPFS